MRNYLLLGAAAAAIVVPVAASAQQITSGIVGTVADETGAPIAGATVTITDNRTGTQRSLTTGADGNFSAPGLVTGGPYTVAATADGFEGQTVNDIITNLQGNTSLTFALSSGAGEIVVTGARVRATQLAVGPGQSFGAELMESVPSFNRDIRDVLRIDPRVSLDRDESGTDRVSCLGGNDRSNGFTVDGIAQGDIYGLSDTPFASRSSSPIPYDAVRETQVQFAPFDVEFGGFTGCAINVVTKSGSNEFTGSAFFEYSNNDELGGSRAAGQSLSLLRASEKRWGATLGGPIIKDKLFFFGAYEQIKSNDPEEAGPAGAGYANPIANIPLADFENISRIARDVYGIDNGGLARSLPFDNRRFFGRLDWYITEDHRLEGTYQRIDETTVRSDDFFTTGSSPQAIGYNTYIRQGSHSDFASVRLYSQWSDNFSTELRYSKSKITDEQDPIGGGEADSANPIPRLIVGVQNTAGGVTSRGAVLIGPGANRSLNELYTEIDQYKAKGTLSLGNHEISVGAEVNQAYIYNLFVNNATGTLVFRNAADFAQGLLSPGTGTNQTSTSNSSNIANGVVEGAFISATPNGDVRSAAAEVRRTMFSIYAQDEWQASDRLNLVLGTRLDWFDGGRPVLNQVFANRYGTTNLTGFSNLDPVILPRAAFTYDFDDVGPLNRVQVKGGVGIFSGGDPIVWFGNSFQNNGRAFAQGSTDTSQGCPGGQIDVVVGGVFTGIPRCAITAASNAAATSQGSTQSIDPDIKTPTVVRANLGIQAELGFAASGFFSGWRVNADYIWARTRNPLTIVDLAQAVDTRRGLNGFALDGRPIYSQIDPALPGCTARLVDGGSPPVYSGVNASCYTTAFNRVDELRLTNADGYTSQIASLILSKQFQRGIFTDGGSVSINIGYAYTDSKDRRNLFNSTAGSNYDNVAAYDRQNPAASTGFYASKHNITFSSYFKEKFFGDYDTSFGFTFVARSGRPYSLTFTGGGVFNASASGSDNALLYVPTGPNDPNVVWAPTVVSGVTTRTADQNRDDLLSFLNTISCDDKYRGRTVARNTCENDWFFDLDLSFSQELPGPGRLFGLSDSIKLYATMDNFLNFLDSDWNVARRRSTQGFQDIAGLSSSGVDAQGRYVINSYSGDTFDADNQLKLNSSLWRIKVGVSYRF